MTTVVLERTLPASAERVFAFVTRRENVLTWWGPEGATVPEETLDFSRTGPWHSVMVNSEGRRFKVSGRVTRVEPPNLVAFTWGWHDADDRRGHESHVTIEITDAGLGRAHLRLSHADLPDAEAREQHAKGWTSSLKKLERQLNPHLNP